MFCSNPPTPSPTNNRQVQVSEQVFDPLRIPIIIGNEIYLLTQQDVRNIVDTRYISCTKLQNSTPGVMENQNGALQDLLNNAVNMRQQIMQSYEGAYSIPSPQQNQQNLCQIIPPNSINIPASSPLQTTTAPIQTQLDWEMKCVENQPPFQSQFTYCKKTSTTDLKSSRKVQFTEKEDPKCTCGRKYFTCKGINVCDEDFTEESSTEPSAREQLKEKKKKESLSL